MKRPPSSHFPRSKIPASNKEPHRASPRTAGHDKGPHQMSPCIVSIRSDRHTRHLPPAYPPSASFSRLLHGWFPPQPIAVPRPTRGPKPCNRRRLDIPGESPGLTRKLRPRTAKAGRIPTSIPSGFDAFRPLSQQGGHNYDNRGYLAVRDRDPITRGAPCTSVLGIAALIRATALSVIMCFRRCPPQNEPIFGSSRAYYAFATTSDI